MTYLVERHWVSGPEPKPLKWLLRWGFSLLFRCGEASMTAVYSDLCLAFFYPWILERLKWEGESSDSLECACKKSHISYLRLIPLLECMQFLTGNVFYSRELSSIFPPNSSKCFKWAGGGFTEVHSLALWGINSPLWGTWECTQIVSMVVGAVIQQHGLEANK